MTDSEPEALPTIAVPPMLGLMGLALAGLGGMLDSLEQYATTVKRRSCEVAFGPDAKHLTDVDESVVCYVGGDLRLAPEVSMSDVDFFASYLLHLKPWAIAWVAVSAALLVGGTAYIAWRVRR